MAAIRFWCDYIAFLVNGIFSLFHTCLSIGQPIRSYTYMNVLYGLVS